MLREAALAQARAAADRAVGLAASVVLAQVLGRSSSWASTTKAAAAGSSQGTHTESCTADCHSLSSHRPTADLLSRPGVCSQVTLAPGAVEVTRTATGRLGLRAEKLGLDVSLALDDDTLCELLGAWLAGVR